MAGLELVADKDTRMPFDPALKIGARVGDAARNHGLIARIVGDRVVFSPPIIIAEQEVDQIYEILLRALDEVYEKIK